ncbi:MAG: hypothetical protein IJN92_02075 [Lachnospiraceae bacterium]|nr:hypothetical protein [Lachnospiraceae bacterium]
MQKTNLCKGERDVMSLEGFSIYMRISLQNRLGVDFKVTVQKVTKNNGVQLIGLQIQEERANIAPVFYLEEYYCKYIKNPACLEQLEVELLKTYVTDRKPVHFNSKDFLEWESASKKIAYKLINYEQNMQLLEEVPHIQFLDLAIVFFYVVEEIESATVLIHNKHLDFWKTDTLDLYRVAKRNTPRIFPHIIKSIRGVMEEIMPGCSEKMEVEQESLMFVLYNNIRVNGAVCMLYPNVLKDFANATGGDVYILPSSTHEVILIPAYGWNYGEKELAEMVGEVNVTEVSPEEILSNHAYKYVRNLDKVMIIGER